MKTFMGYLGGPNAVNKRREQTAKELAFMAELREQIIRKDRLDKLIVRIINTVVIVAMLGGAIAINRHSSNSVAIASTQR